MFSRHKDDDVDRTGETHRDERAVSTETRTAAVARGGLSLWSILTGVLVAFGLMFLLSAIAGAIIMNTDLEADLAAGNAVEVGIGAIVVLALVQFLSYMWGGYTAGRMARGSGLANGILVPVTALLIAAIVFGIAQALGETTSLGLPFVENRLPTNNDALLDLGVAGGIASLVAMLLGGLLGGLLGARWHTKLERRAIADHDAKTIDIREGRTTSNDAPRSHTTEHTRSATSDDGSYSEHERHATATPPNEAAVDQREPIHTRPASESHTNR